MAGLEEVDNLSILTAVYQPLVGQRRNTRGVRWVRKTEGGLEAVDRSRAVSLKEHLSPIQN